MDLYCMVFILFYRLFRRNMIVFYSRCCLEGFLFHALWKYGEQWGSFSLGMWICVLVCVCGINVAERCEERGVAPMTHRSWGLRITQTHTRRASFYSARLRRVEMSINFDWPHCAGLQMKGAAAVLWACDEIVCDLFGESAKWLLYEADCSRRDDYIKCLIGYDWLNSSVSRASSCLFINFSVICQMFIHASIHPSGVILRFQDKFK